MKMDPNESNNLARENKDLVRKYKELIDNYVRNGGYVDEQSGKTYAKGYPVLHGGVWAPWLD